MGGGGKVPHLFLVKLRETSLEVELPLLVHRQAPTGPARTAIEEMVPLAWKRSRARSCPAGRARRPTVLSRVWVGQRQETLRYDIFDHAMEHGTVTVTVNRKREQRVGVWAQAAEKTGTESAGFLSSRNAQ